MRGCQKHPNAGGGSRGRLDRLVAIHPSNVASQRVEPLGRVLLQNGSIGSTPVRIWMPIEGPRWGPWLRALTGIHQSADARVHRTRRETLPPADARKATPSEPWWIDGAMHTCAPDHQEKVVFNEVARRNLGVILVAVIVAIATWSLIRILGVEPTVGKGSAPIR